MFVSKRALAGFLEDESGAVTVDWVALVGGVLLLGLVVVFTIFANGVTPLSVKIGDTLSEARAGMCGELEAGLQLDEGDCDVISSGSTDAG